MDFDFISMIVQMLFALGIILLLMLLTYKVASTKVNSINQNKYIKVLERVQISKDAYICLIKIGKRGHVALISQGHTEIIQELSQEELFEVEEGKKVELQKMQVAYEGIIGSGKSILEKINSKYSLKEEKNEE